MKEYKYRFYSSLHLMAKKMLGRMSLSTNTNLFSHLDYYKNLGIDEQSAESKWINFIRNSAIDKSALHYAGYCIETASWRLPSWVWTNAAIVRMYCAIGNLQEAQKIAASLELLQHKCGGWIVRNDYDAHGAKPIIAPNDSAYIANNAFISLYELTRDVRYLNVAIRCGNWIMETMREDGMVYVGYNQRDEVWDKSCVIVDVGFTAGLFAKLVEHTGGKKYKQFLSLFVKRYIQLFFCYENNGFATSIDANNSKLGGMFGRGQAWALEGLLPAYLVLKDEHIKQIIKLTVGSLIKLQLKNGGWSYNLTKPLLGEDCKAISVIALNLMKWYEISHDILAKRAAQKALKWCYKHTAKEGIYQGGIFSFCMEGVIVKDLYSSCAFTYASAYAIELKQQLEHG